MRSGEADVAGGTGGAGVAECGWPGWGGLVKVNGLQL